VRRRDHVRRDDRPTGSTPTCDVAHGEPGEAQPQQVGLTLNDWAMLREQLGRMEVSLAVLVERQTVKDWYTTEEAAKALGKADFTVREWCRQGRVHAKKKGSGRGMYQSWVISHAELQRIQREGLLPAQHR
jgi:DNA-directed RNA polymerase specialized sigma24 family protein